MGPLVLFDKSFLQSLSQDEAILFDVLFRTNMVPIFYMETIADLDKETKEGRTPEEEVRIIAAKTPTWGSCVNTSHISLCARELMGQLMKMDQMPIVSHGRPTEVQGKKGWYLRPSREQYAFERWQDGHFKDIERVMAREWRGIVLNPPKLIIPKTGLRFTDLAAVRARTKELLLLPDTKWDIFNLGIKTAGFSQRQMWRAIKPWCLQNFPHMALYAPYIHYIAQVDWFFAMAVLSGHISADRASNKIDCAYLYYLPFTQIFISSDKLHARMTPHFLESTQRFVWGPDLKADLKRLVEVFKGDPDIGRLGLVKVASSPPKQDTGLVAQLYDSYLPSWRQEKDLTKAIDTDPVLHAKLMKQIKEMEESTRKPLTGASSKGFSREEIDVLTIERRVAKKRGNWQFLPADLKDD